MSDALIRQVYSFLPPRAFMEELKSKYTQMCCVCDVGVSDSDFHAPVTCQRVVCGSCLRQPSTRVWYLQDVASRTRVQTEVLDVCALRYWVSLDSFHNEILKRRPPCFTVDEVAALLGHPKAWPDSICDFMGNDMEYKELTTRKWLHDMVVDYRRACERKSGAYAALVRMQNLIERMDADMEGTRMPPVQCLRDFKACVQQRNFSSWPLDLPQTRWDVAFSRRSSISSISSSVSAVRLDGEDIYHECVIG